MAMKLSCNNIDPNSTCDYVAEGNSIDETIVAIMEHTKAEHPETFTDLNTTEERLSQELRTKVHV